VRGFADVADVIMLFYRDIQPKITANEHMKAFVVIKHLESAVILIEIPFDDDNFGN
jgi:hypothetical protein